MKRFGIIIMLTVLTVFTAGCSKQKVDVDVASVKAARDEQSVTNPYSDAEMEEIKALLTEEVSKFCSEDTDEYYVANGCAFLQANLYGTWYIFKAEVRRDENGFYLENVMSYQLVG